jgi:hypothetical protein
VSVLGETLVTGGGIVSVFGECLVITGAGL